MDSLKNVAIAAVVFTLMMSVTNCAMKGFISKIGGQTFITKNEKLIDVKYTGAIDDSTAIYGGIMRIENSSIGACTAFAISNQYALTAGHCLYDNYKLITEDYILFNEKNEKVGKAKAASFNARRDFGVLRGDFSKFRKAPVRFETSLTQGWSGEFVACGFPEGSIKTYCEPVKVLGLSSFFLMGVAPVFPGMSGGPVFDINTGEVIAVVIAGSDGGPNLVMTPLIAFDAGLGIEDVKPKE